MGLFDKKFCDICGEKIGLFGNRKLEDGNLCKNCAGKLSRWFDDRRHATVEEIRAQLAYREENKARVASFHTTRTFGESSLLRLDEDGNRFLVSRTDDLLEENPDVLDNAQVTGCDVDVVENRSEIKRDGPDGKKVSYDPPRYAYRYDFYVQIRVNHPYFDDIRFQLNRRTVEITPPGARAVLAARPDPRSSVEYVRYEKMGAEIQEALLAARQEVRDAVETAAAPKQKAVCPACGASTLPDANGCCEYCGSPVA